jgi:flagellar P-ring protein precursor FlgI
MRALALVAALLVLPAAASAARLKEVANVQGVRDNQLFGYGLVVGLAGTGDSDRIFFTSQSIAGMLGRLGIRVDPKEVHARNVAAVMVTATLPPFARPGSELDVAVASMGNARSLAGGVLLVTPLSGLDGEVYATAQGPVQLGGYEASAAGTSVQKNQPTSGRVPGGALVERTVGVDLGKGPLLLTLRKPDFTTADRIATAVNGALGDGAARALDPAAVEVKLPEGADPVGLLAKIEALEVTPDARAKVVVSERTGTVVAGSGVRIRPVTVAHGGLQVAIAETPTVSQPGPFASGTTVSGRVASVEAREGAGRAVALPGTTTVEDLAAALNLLGTTPRDLVAIFQAIEAAGALDAELEVL